MSYRFALLMSAILLVPIGAVLRFSQWFGLAWLHDALGSVAYEMFWIVLVLFCLPKRSPLKVAISVCLATCTIEVLQLWQPPLLQALRATLPGRLILGNTFAWLDFLPYGIGSFCGWAWVLFLRKTTRRHESSF
ncbi:MAG: DUF2809 domain-containing protein [Leptolyngbyaceae cyanobacterium CSU_1_3]|nr:DUF2809 domain-containing protein [Leptolyngbyaceae cyanobacterium CSU_1_3]